MNFCIPRETAKKIVESLKKIGYEELSNMPIEKQVDIFSKHIPKDQAKVLAESFSKAVEENDMRAVVAWAKENLSPKKQKEVEGTQRDKFLKAIKSGTINQDLVKKQLGVELSEEEVKTFTRIGKEYYDKRSALVTKDGVDNLGNIMNDYWAKKNKEFLKVQREMEEYVATASPSVGNFKMYMKFYSKLALLTGLKSITLNVESAVPMLTEAITRRFALLGAGYGSGKQMKDYIRRAVSVYNQTDFDVSRSLGLDADKNVLGYGKMYGEEMVVPKNKFGELWGKAIFKYGLGWADNAVASFHFADSAGIMSRSIAKNVSGENLGIKFGLDEELFKGKKPNKIAELLFEDATRLSPTTEAGRLIREISVYNAKIGTFTQKGAISEFSMRLKRDLNKAGEFGEYLMPFVKTPSNIIATGLDYSGLGFARGGLKFLKSITTGKKLTGAEKYDAIRGIVNGGMGLAIGTLIVNLINIQDYMGAYTPQGQQERELKNAPTDSVKIGDDYYSLDYFGQLRTPIKFLLELKAGKIKSEAVEESLLDMGVRGFEAYGKTLISEAQNLPVMEGLDIKGEMEDFEQKGMKKLLSELPSKFIDTIASRTIPAQIGDIAKMIDDKGRNIKTGKYSVFDPLIAKVPFAREILPAKTTVLGETVQEAPGLAVLFAGERFKEANNSPIGKEYARLEESGNKPRFIDVTYTNSQKVKAIEEKVGKEKMLEFKKQIGEKSSERILEVMKTEKYKAMSDEDKKEIMEKIHEDEYKKFLAEQGQGEYNPKETQDIIKNTEVSKAKEKNAIEGDITSYDNYKKLSKIGDKERETILGDYAESTQKEIKKWEVAEKSPTLTGSERMQKKELGKLLGLKDEKGKDEKASIDQLYSHYKKVAIIKGEDEYLIAKKPNWWNVRDGAIIIENPNIEQLFENETFVNSSLEKRQKAVENLFVKGVLTKKDFIDWKILNGDVKEETYKTWLKNR